MGIKFANNASSLLAAPILAADLTLTVTDADAALFPTLGVGDYVFVTLEDRRVVPNLREIVKCTARTDNLLTVIRAQDDTTAHDFFLGAVVSARLTRAALLAFLLEETTRAEAAEAAEATARAAADATELARAQAAEAAITVAFTAADDAESATRAAADTAETNARAVAVAAEATARAAADTAEASARAAGDATNAAAIAAEASTRAAGDATNAAAIAAETAARIAADSALSAAIGAIPVVTSSLQSGTVTSNGSGAFSVTFSPAFSTAGDYAAVDFARSAGLVAGVQSPVLSASTYSGILVDNFNDPVPGYTIGWFAAGR